MNFLSHIIPGQNKIKRYSKNASVIYRSFAYSWKAISFPKGKLMKDKNGYKLWYLHDDAGDAL